MTRLVEHAALALAPLGALLLVLAAWSALRGGIWRGPRALCPGPRPRWWSCVSPARLIWSPACGYDLSALPVDAAGAVRCPECGSVQPRGRRVRRAGGWRFGPAAVVLLTLALACWNIRWIRAGKWALYLPTPVLLAMDEAASSRLPDTVRWELNDRAEGMWRVWRPWLIRRAVAGLGDDEVKYNAEWGINVIEHTLPASLPAVERVLRDGDPQRRKIAAWVLMSRALLPPADRRALVAYTPPTDLYRVAVESLADDRLDYAGDTYVNNAYTAMDFLLRAVGPAEPFLAEALRSPDFQQRVYAASVCAVARHPRLARPAAVVLCESLTDNAWEGDARLAYRSLLLMGPDALAPLEACYDRHAEGGPAPDHQAAATTELLIRRLRGDALTEAELRKLNVITWTAVDPGDQAFYGPAVWPADPGRR